MIASNYIPKNVKVVIQSENGILGMVCVGRAFKRIDFSDIIRAPTHFLGRRTLTLSMLERRQLP